VLLLVQVDAAEHPNDGPERMTAGFMHMATRPNCDPALTVDDPRIDLPRRDRTLDGMGKGVVQYQKHCVLLGRMKKSVHQAPPP
jgi:hypothetical protein